MGRTNEEINDMVIEKKVYLKGKPFPKTFYGHLDRARIEGFIRGLRWSQGLEDFDLD